MSIWDSDGVQPLLAKPSNGGPFWDGEYQTQESLQKAIDAYNTQQSALSAALPKVKTKDEFMATVKPDMLDAQGRFKGPQAGVNYMFEGMTPDDAYSRFSSQPQPKSIDGDEGDTSSLSYWQNKQNAINSANAILDAGWREGPDNGGGFIGGLGRFTKGVLSIPPISMALTAGVAPMLSGSISSATGLGKAGANIAAKGILNAGKTLVSGGNLGDVAKSAGLSYLGGVAGDAAGSAVGDATGNAVAAKIASTLAKSAIGGGGSAVGAITSAAVGMITDNIDGFSELSQVQKSVINSMIANAIQGKKITPALIAQVMASASNEARKNPSVRTTAIKTNGWAA